MGFVTGATPDKWAGTWRERQREPIELVPVTEDVQEHGVRTGALDVALVRLPVDRDGLHLIPLYEELPVAVMNVDNEQDLDEMFLNDGSGASFTKMAADIPKPSNTGKFEDRATTRGRGDSVTVIPNWRNTGRAAFLVFNGFRQNPGPVQLIEFYETP